MDIQVNFTEPTKISQTASEPDALKIRFKESAMFMDKIEFEQLDDELAIEFNIQP